MKNPLLNPVVFAAALLSACQMGAPSEALELKSDRDPVQIMVSIGKTAQACWFKSKDPAFSAYRLAPELKSFTGTPRILVVKKNAPEALPLLVVQAQGSPARLDAFGPLMQDAALNARIGKDVNRWARGGKDC